VTGVWRKLRNEELHDLYSSPRIIRIIKSRRMSGSIFNLSINIVFCCFHVIH
jgi:hypothetical protein